MRKKLFTWKHAVYCLITLFLSIFYVVSSNYLFGKVYVGQWGLIVGLLDLVLFLCLLLVKGPAAKVVLRFLTGLLLLAHIPALMCWLFVGGIIAWIWLWPIGILAHLGMLIWSAKICFGK